MSTSADVPLSLEVSAEHIKIKTSKPQELNPPMENTKKRAGSDSTGGRHAKRKAFVESSRRLSM